MCLPDVAHFGHTRTHPHESSGEYHDDLQMYGAVHVYVIMPCATGHALPFRAPWELLGCVAGSQLVDQRIAIYGAGIELASSCTRVTTDRGKALMFITAGAGSALGNQAYGALAGTGSVCNHLLGRWCYTCCQ